MPGFGASQLELALEIGEGNILRGDFDLAEEAMHEAFAAALSLWPRSGIPDNPRPWLISTARFKAIDTLRRHRRERFDASEDELVRYLEAQSSSRFNTEA